MKKLTLTDNAKFYLFFVLAALVITGLPVEAQAKISDMFTNVGNEAPAVTTSLIKIFALIGIVFIAVGVIGFMTRHKTQIPAGVCVGMFVGGVLLLGIIDLSTEGLDSLFGSSSNSGLDQITGSTH